jgi:hypothetical protein
VLKCSTCMRGCLIGEAWLAGSDANDRQGGDVSSSMPLGAALVTRDERGTCSVKSLTGSVMQYRLSERCIGANQCGTALCEEQGTVTQRKDKWIT